MWCFICQLYVVHKVYFSRHSETVRLVRTFCSDINKQHQYFRSSMSLPLSQSARHQSFHYAWFQTSAVVQIRFFTLLECHAALIGSYRRFGIIYLPHLQGSSNPKKDILLKLLDPWKFNRYFVPKRRYGATNHLCVTSQKSIEVHFDYATSHLFFLILITFLKSI